MANDIGQKDLLLSEYSEACTNMRFYGNLQFAVLTVFLALLVGIVAFSFGLVINVPVSETITSSIPASLNTLSKIGGIVATFIFWTLEERLISYWYHNKRRAIELEKELGYNLHLRRPKPLLGFLNTTFAMRLLYLCVGIFWVYALFI
jgi:hypothetical protein